MVKEMEKAHYFIKMEKLNILEILKKMFVRKKIKILIKMVMM